MTMLHFTQDDRQMMNHVVDVIGDRMHHEDGYTDQDRATVKKLDQLAKAPHAVVLTGDEVALGDNVAMLRQVVTLELKHWVPNASQRLIYRAAAALELTQPYPKVEDHGPDAGMHVLVADWVAGLYLLRCATCCRLFPHDAPGAARLH